MKRLLRVKDVAFVLNCTADIVRQLLREGSIRFIRLSGDDDGIRIRPETLEQFLDEQEQLEDDEPEAPPSVPKKEIVLKNLTLDS